MSSTQEFDPLSPEMLENPYPVYAELQEKHPVFWHKGLGAWVVTRYQDCRDILMNSELFVRDPRRVSEASSEASESIQTLDQTDQVALRRLVVGSMNSQDLDELGVRVRASIDRIFESVASRPSFDWMSEVAAPLAGTITADLLGVGSPDPMVFKAIVEGMARKFDADIGAEDPEAAARTQQAFGVVIDGWLNAEDTHGTILALKERATELGIPVPPIRNSIGLLFIGSFGTIFASSGNLAMMLIERPEVLEWLRDPALLGTGVDEFLRFDGPTHATSRVAVRDTEIRDVTIRRGDPVFIVLAAANRDPDQFPRPQELLLDRTPNKHLAFGWGPHSCLGALFGQLALRQLVRALHDAPLRMTGTPVRLRTATVRGNASLPVTFQV